MSKMERSPAAGWSLGSRAARAAATLLVATALALGAGHSRADDAAPAIPRTPAPPDAKLYFISPEDGATVASPVRVRFGLSGMGVAPAGIDYPHSGHHHVIVDAELPPLDKPIPADENYRHFGKGQTETTLELPAGTHTLQLLLGDRNHVPHQPPIRSEKITITVE